MGSNPLTVSSGITAGQYTLDGGVSSQFISGLLFALPLLDRPSTLTVTGKIESGSYIDMTLDALRQFGIRVTMEENVESGTCLSSTKTTNNVSV